MKRVKMILCALLSVLMISVPVAGSVVTAGAEDVDSLRSRLTELKQKESEYKDILNKSATSLTVKKPPFNIFQPPSAKFCSSIFMPSELRKNRVFIERLGYFAISHSHSIRFAI